MWRPSPLHISFAPLAWCLLLSISVLTIAALTGCKHYKEEDEPTSSSDHPVSANGMVIYATDSTEWHVRLFAEHLIYTKAMGVELPPPWLLPTREDAAILKTCTYPHDERFITSDGYTFGMPSASVSKAGAKTKYSVLGLYIRQTVIDVPF